MTLEVADSELENGSDDALETGTSPDTSTSDGHTTDSVDVDGLLKQLEAHKDSIPEERLEFLNKRFQPAFSRRVNLLNNNVETAVRTTLGEEFKIPDGKSALDLLTEDGGKGFAEMLKGVIAKEVGPVREAMSTAQGEQTIRQHMELAAVDYPAVKTHFKEAVALIDANPDLVALAHAGGGKGVYYVLQGAAATIEAQKGIQSRDREIKELKEVLAKHNIAVKTSNGASKAGGSKKPDSVAPAKSLKEALNRAAAKVAEQEN